MLNGQLAEVTGRLSRLASIRADYSTQVAETRNRTELLERAEQQLSEVRISQASAAASSLISAIDSAEAGINPVGPSRAVIVLVGLVGGLMAGLGILLLSAQPAPPAVTHRIGWMSNDLPGKSNSSAGSPDRESHLSEDSLSLTEALDKLVRNRVLWN
jgi:hypothetical protein